MNSIKAEVPPVFKEDFELIIYPYHLLDKDKVLYKPQSIISGLLLASQQSEVDAYRVVTGSAWHKWAETSIHYGWYPRRVKHMMRFAMLEFRSRYNNILPEGWIYFDGWDLRKVANELSHA